ncbi:hypothetical protein AB0P36_28210 [Streptomyces flavidovirens]|uniref:hypothetical protein n=1 Tax=Streptomyces flavidovirens TaxID=67298 RepID=UPI00342B99E8
MQRRHQKAVEIAPRRPSTSSCARICADAVAFARHIRYVKAGTGGLVDERGNHVFTV